MEVLEEAKSGGAKEFKDCFVEDCLERTGREEGVKRNCIQLLNLSLTLVNLAHALKMTLPLKDLSKNYTSLLVRIVFPDVSKPSSKSPYFSLN